MNYKTKKRFGQHFLHDQNIIMKLVRSIHPKHDDNIVEIGPGLGALTFPLLQELDHLNVVELDRDVIARLKSIGDTKGKFTIHESDALKFDFAQLATGDKTLRVVGNLPYNISTPLIFHLLEHKQNIIDMHFMLQKEVVDRLTAEPGSKDYGRLSVMAQYHCQCEYLFFVPPGAFNPPPKVDSAIIRMQPWTKPPFKANDPARLAEIVQAAFSKRRKTLRNSLKDHLDGEQIEAAGVDPSLRPEVLSVEQFVALANVTD
jgi:16S rRNA (adenine1518-N6/adenine1519-N6)-dimethyltransferase